MNYNDLGLKCGLEIHQRLNTKKLFCGCSSTMKEGPTAKVMRTLTAVAGETEEIDPAALHEQQRDRTFYYAVYSNESCLVELDEEPPHAINPDALYAALQVAKMLHCDIPDEIHVMRKIVIDGSNTGGFQRTAIVGLGGHINTSFGRVGITNVSLEEESAQILEREGRTVTYGLNRLGIPLIEIGTAPDAHTPEQARELAEALGSLLRSTGRVQRGLGTIRQDVNVSIKGGARVEIKGFQELREMEILIEREVERQSALLALAEELILRKAHATDPVEVTHIFTNTANTMLAKMVASGKRIYAFVLKGYGGMLKKPISGQRTFGRELADYALAQGTKGMIHSDEQIGSYNLNAEFAMLKEKFGVGPSDAICIIAEDERVALRACRAVVERAKRALKGVPEETRAPSQNMTSSYARPLPGGARMYPETDVPPIRVDKKLLERIKLPEGLDAKRRRLASLGVAEQTAAELADSEMLPIFEEAVKTGADPRRASEVLTSTMKALRREGLAVDKIESEDMIQLLQNVAELPKEAVLDALKTLAEGKRYTEAVHVQHLGPRELESLVEKVIKGNMDLINKEGEVAFKKLMGPLMAEVRGRVDGKVAAKALEKRLRSVLR